MCIIVDTNTFGDLINGSSTFHDDYQPIIDWVINGNGKFVIGGTKYFEELKRHHKILKLFGELNKKNKIVNVCNEKVDEYQLELQKNYSEDDFDDPHLVSIVAISNCRLICTRDSRAIPYLTDRKYFPKGIKPPKIYSGKRNRNLLCDRYIAEICKPCNRLKRSDRQQLQ